MTGWLYVGAKDGDGAPLWCDHCGEQLALNLTDQELGCWGCAKGGSPVPSAWELEHEIAELEMWREALAQ